MTKPVKVEFVSRDGTVETAWCTPLVGSRYRVDNVLFLSAKPTFGDVIEVTGEHRFRRVVKSGGRVAVVLDCANPKAVKKQLAALDVVAEVAVEGLLHVAVPKSVSVAHVKKLVAAAPAVAPKSQPTEALFEAADRGDLSTLRRAKRSELEVVDKKGCSLLFIATREGRLDVVKWLLSKGASPNPRSKKERAPLVAAAYRDRPREAQALLDAGADVSLARDRDGDPLLVLAAFRESRKLLPVLLATKPTVKVLSHALLEAAASATWPS